MELPNGEKGSVLIHNNHLEMWGIDEKTLKEVAWDNMHNYFPPEFASLGKVLRSLGYNEIPEGAELIEMYVLTNKDKHYGAAYMFDKEVMSRIAEEMGGDIVVLPSSIHESILLKKEKKNDINPLYRERGRGTGKFHTLHRRVYFFMFFLAWKMHLFFSALFFENRTRGPPGVLHFRQITKWRTFACQNGEKYG